MKKANGYADIVIAINPKIPEDVRLIEKIKEMVTDASSYMFKATKQRLFIRSVKVLIPNTWSSSNTYGRPKTETYDKLDIIIADPFIYGDYPYTLQYGGCGVNGKYIHLTPNFMLNEKVLDIYGPRGRVFVHEWARLRWGVFDEYNFDIPFYRTKEGNIEAARCPLTMRGLCKVEVCIGVMCDKENCEIDPDTGLYADGCEFYPNMDQGVHESIMYTQTLDPVNAFCDEKSHNKDAPNEQNRLCKYQSTWEVIMKSPDMASAAQLKDPMVPPPTISLLQYTDQENRISRMYQASEVFIMQIVERGSYLGIVTFSDRATVRSELVKIVDTFQREKLKTFLPKVASGGTKICAWICKGFEVNKKIDGSTHGTEIALLTDGEDNQINSCLDEVRASGAIIHTVALGGNADKGLEQLSYNTGSLNPYLRNIRVPLGHGTGTLQDRQCQVNLEFCAPFFLRMSGNRKRKSTVVSSSTQTMETPGGAGPEPSNPDTAAIMAAIASCQNVLTTKFDTLQEQFNYFRHDLDKIRDRTGENERRIGETEDRLSVQAGELATLRRQVTVLLGRTEDSENRNRRNNVEFTVRGTDLEKPVSTLYRCLVAGLESPRGKIESRWLTLDQTLDPDDWEEILDNLHSSVIEARDRFIQTKWIHQAYITPIRLHKMGLLANDLCPSWEEGLFLRGLPWGDPKEMTVTTDASAWGWGAHCKTWTAQGKWSRTLSQSSSNLRELVAIKEALWSLKSHLRGKHVQIRSDNTTSVAYIKHQGGTRSSKLIAIAWEILSWAEINLKSLTAIHLKGTLNQVADFLSRSQMKESDWSLDPDVFKTICVQRGVPEVDLFASARNHKVDQYFSLDPRDRSLGVDALARPWHFNLAYAFPPVFDSNGAEEAREGTSYSSPGSSVVAKDSIQDPWEIPVTPHLLSQGPVYCPNPQRWRLTVWSLKSPYCERRDFQPQRPFRGSGTNIDAMKRSGILFLVSFLQLTWSAKDSQVKLKNNGYEDIVIAINPKIPESEKLINNIKKMVTDASSYMLQATENGVYIRSVKILMPNTWKSNSTYGRPKTESYDKADIIVTDPYIYGDYPYTLQYGGCGEPGKYVHLTPNFLLNDQVLQIFGPRGRVFVHEWAHLRWGVFDEYNDNIPWYRSKEGKVEATRCPLSLGGLAKVQLETSEYVECLMDDTTGVYEEGCTFFPNVDPNVHESVMYGQALEPVHEFCKKDTHNREAPNEQNRLCQQQSSWEVIMKSSDIKSSAPLPNSNVPAPTFSLLQYKDRVVTLVLDISGSMGQYNRIDRLYQASEVYIMQIVETGASVGIVVFSSDATITSSLVKITDTFKREQLKKLLPTVANGGTNICAGVRKGFEVNKALDGSTYGTEIVLLTDGEDSGISSCFAEVETSGAVIHTIALGGSADPGLEQLSNKTGGLKLFASDKVDANGLIDSFSGITSGSGDVSAQSIQLESTAKAVESQQCLTDKVTIDSTVGNDTFFLVTWSIATPNIKLTDPNGNIFENAQFAVDATSKSARLRVPGTAQQGDWHYNLCNTQPGAQVLGITVNSRPADPSVPPILVETYLSADANSFGTPMVVYATVTQGLAPVLGVKVTAYIETQTGHITPLTLLDNGAGADIIKNDGIYSKFYTDYNGNGRYSVKVRVENQGKDNKGGVPKSRALYLPGYVENGTLVTTPKPKITIEDLNLGNFTRTSSGGSFVVTNVPSGPLPDIHGPSKISNLEARIENKTVILTWTATGDDLDKGNASMYDLRMSFNSDELLDNFENGTRVNTTSIIPKPAGSVEYFSFTPVNITIKNGTVFYFSLVAIDKVNQRSAPSNLARAAMFLPTPPPPPPPPTSRPYPTIKPGNSATGVTGSMNTIILFLVTITALHSTVVES
ncbi:LOW QUALITY PROTEIN: uncharacterized protein PAF06_000862 [Gastrophryne carolinensis]